MLSSPNTQAILLLTTHFAKAREEAVKPLTPKEWGRFARWLKEQSLTPEQLIRGHLGEMLRGWSDKTITLERIEGLLNRGSALALAMEKWLRAGLWVMTRSDPDYPTRLKKRLKTDSPAIFFGCGNRALLNGGGLAVVGSRNATGEDLVYSRELGAVAAREGRSIVSGGARGVDEAAMLGALEAEGTVIGVLAAGLLRASSSARYRRHLLANNLVLVSPFYPEAGFNVGNAMQRNKYIYCLADAAMVVHSGTKGGTWNGAMENLEKHWVPLWVKQTSDPAAGNRAIVRVGGMEAPHTVEALDFGSLFSIKPRAVVNGEDGFTRAAAIVDGTEGTSIGTGAETGMPDVVAKATCEAGLASHSPYDTPHIGQAESPPAHLAQNLDFLDFYELFLLKMASLCSDAPKTPDELLESMQVNRTQLNTWLKQAVAEEKLKKFTRPVRYQWRDSHQGTLPL